jgi:glycosyltransferase involved in cell wall biosynthesis
VRYDKGVHLAVRALQHLPTNVELWVTGEPEDAESATYKDDLQHLVDVGGLGGRVLFLGLRRDIYGIMSRADVIVVPSVWREPFGLVAAEAMALERPVVVANRGALPEVVDHGRAGLVFDPEVDGSLAEKVAETIADGAATGQRVENGRRRVNSLFGYDRWVSEIAEILKTASTAGKTGTARFLRMGLHSGGEHG